MIEMLPGYYRKSVITAQIYKTIENFFKKHDVDANDFFITTTTDFEKFLKNVGIDPGIDADDETKRSMVISRLQGGSSLTISGLRELINLYEDCEFELIESPNKVIISFTGRKGMPRNAPQLMAHIKTVKPAYVVIAVETKYTTWRQASDSIGTWTAAKSYTWGNGSKLEENV